MDEIISKSKFTFEMYKNINRVELFGSFSKGTQTINSDIDFLIYGDLSLVEILTISVELERIFNRRVDIVIKDDLTSPILIKSIIESPNNVIIFKR